MRFLLPAAIAIALTAVSLFHLMVFVPIPEKNIAHDPDMDNKKIDTK